MFKTIIKIDTLSGMETSRIKVNRFKADKVLKQLNDMEKGIYPPLVVWKFA